MQSYHSIDSIHLPSAWLTIGIFDGVHRGHQELLNRLVAGAHAEGYPAVVLTFYPHPAVVLGGKKDLKFLTTPDERIELMELFGVDVVITQTFDHTLADQTAEEFMRRVMRTVNLRRLIVGYDTAFGRGRKGDAAQLTTIGKELGYTVQTIPPLKDKAGILSSTRIRAAIAAGDVSSAATDLGRYFSITGPVIHGNGRGHAINIPTANIQVPAEKLVPINGIYATWAWVKGEKYRAATNIGTRPTFSPNESVPHVEAHLLEFNHDLYGQQVKLEFVARLRDEQRFPSVEALVAEVKNDINKTKQFLA